MKHEIDFLPARYRTEHVQKRVAVWRAIVLVSFLALLTGLSIAQHRGKRRLEAELVATQRQYGLVWVQAERIDQLDAELRPLNATVELLTYLRHRWPTSQLMAAALEPLPESVVLDLMHVSPDAAPATVGGRSGAPRVRVEAEAPPDDTPPHAKDLAALRKDYDRTRTVIRLSGRSTDLNALHAYVAQLDAHRLIDRAELQSVDVQAAADPGTFRFQVRVVCAPSYAQEGGPAAQAADTTSLAYKPVRLPQADSAAVVAGAAAAETAAAAEPSSSGSATPGGQP